MATNKRHPMTFITGINHLTLVENQEADINWQYFKTNQRNLTGHTCWAKKLIKSYEENKSE